MKRTYSRTIEKSAGFLFARWSAGAKAFELSLPPNKRVITDQYSRYYAGEVGTKLVAMMGVINPSIRKAIVLRARYIDDYSRQCLQDGFEQVVLLGAGYDSRYLRMAELHTARVFELDLACTQVIKKTLTRRLLGKLPANVTYVPIDFSRDPIIDKLMGAGFVRDKRTLFIWEGVTLFLNEAIIAETLGRLTELGPGNRVVFDFVPPELVDDATDYMGNRKLLQLCAAIKEPLTFGCRPDHMRRILQNVGYGKIGMVSMREANRMYCGTDKIEDSYFFATAEVTGNGRGLYPNQGLDPDHNRGLLAGSADRRAGLPQTCQRGTSGDRRALLGAEVTGNGRGPEPDRDSQEAENGKPLIIPA